MKQNHLGYQILYRTPDPVKNRGHFFEIFKKFSEFLGDTHFQNSELQAELETLIDESGEGDVLKAEIYRLRTILNAGKENVRMSSTVGPILRTLMTQIEFSPITKDFIFDGEINTDVGAQNLVRLRYLAHSIRSVASNMLNLSESY